MNQSKKNKVFSKILFSILFLFTFSSFAANTFTSSTFKGEANNNFKIDLKISPSEIQIQKPPQAHSPEDEADLQQILTYQKNRTAEQCKLASKQLHPSFIELFNDTDIISLSDLKLLAPLMNQVVSTTEKISQFYKKQFRRPRPFNENSNIKPCIAKPDGNTAYPSTHAAVSYSSACILAQIYPEKQIELEKYGSYLGELRVIVGVHHHSDIIAGQSIGRQVCNILLKNPLFLEKLDEIKADLPK